MTARPGTVAQILDVDLPRERDYAETMQADEFGAKTSTLRKLLGSISHRHIGLIRGLGVVRQDWRERFGR